MSNAAHAAIARLGAILDAENEALQLPDVSRVAALVPSKVAAAQNLATALEGAGRSADLCSAGIKLRQQIEENTRLLERALAVQGRVVELVARAARSTARPAGRYGAAGRETIEAGALAFITRA